MMRKITVLGGGHGARTIAAEMTLKGHRVTLYEMPQFKDNISEIFKTNTITITGKVTGQAKLYKTTCDIAQAIADSDIILLAVPSFAHLPYAKLLASHLQDGQNFVLIPGTLGSLEMLEEFRKQGIQKNITISELDAMPYATRITGPTSVNVFHKLPKVYMGTFPSVKTESVIEIMRDLYPQVKPLRDVLEAGLSNANPIIHPLGVLLNAGRIEYSRGEFWYYEEGVTFSVAKVLEALDAERLAIGKKLGLQLMTLAEALQDVDYGPKGDLWSTIKGSRGLTPIKGPTTLSNRYITEDVPIGLVCWSQLGEQLGVSTPLMQATIHIAQTIAGEDYFATGRTLKRCGIEGMNADTLIKFVKTGKKE